MPVPEWYFSNVDMSGRRLDHDQRPELRYGSVEFEVPADYYSSRKPAPLSYVFAIDVSAQAVKSGLVEASCEALKETLYGKDAAESNRLERGNKIGLITFDKSVHFYNLAVSPGQFVRTFWIVTNYSVNSLHSHKRRCLSYLILMICLYPYKMVSWLIRRSQSK